ncbi:uncharacterized protein [Epargyreus clarus]|uniref:uncharacterized protein n=1 Tax=Epargyreus clarus TaxID=520877 RepID=UPI003C2AD7D0
MDPVDNNQFEVKPTSKRKIATLGPNVYLNPALDLLANEDPMCNTAMEITPNKRRKRTTSCNITTFENTALDLGISKAAVNEFLARELENVKKNVRNYETPIKLPKTNLVACDIHEPVYTNLSTNLSNSSLPIVATETVLPDSSMPTECALNENISNIDSNMNDVEMDSGISVLDQKSSNTNTLDKIDLSAINSSVQANVTNQIIVNNTSNLSLSFIDKLALDSPCASNQSLYLDDDLNESNIMEIKTITIITKKKLVSKKNTNPFLDPNLKVNINDGVENPFLDTNISKSELEYNVEALNRPVETQIAQTTDLVPRRLFTSDTNSTISTVNESGENEYENIDNYRAESPIYENVGDDTIDSYNKQSKILGCDVSQFSAIDIMNLNRLNQTNASNESTDSKRDLKKQILKASNKLSKKVFKTLKKTFKGEKADNNVTLNPYEVPRKAPKQKAAPKESGIENPALNLDNSDEIEIEEIEDDEHQYETIKTIRNTRLNMNVTPLKERVNENIDISHNKTNTPGKKVRFDSTLNREKIITGDSFDCDIQSPGFDSKIDRYHDELENCINERKFLQQNM